MRFWGADPPAKTVQHATLGTLILEMSGESKSTQQRWACLGFILREMCEATGIELEHETSVERAGDDPAQGERR